MNGHGVALVILTDIPADPEAWALDMTIDGTFGPKLRAQCECGWHASFAEVVTFDLLVDTVDKHREEAAEAARIADFGCDHCMGVDS